MIFVLGTKEHSRLPLFSIFRTLCSRPVTTYGDEILMSTSHPVLFLCHNAGRVVFAEGSLSKFRAAQFGVGLFEPLVGLLRPVGAAVLEHELVDCELLVRPRLTATPLTVRLGWHFGSPARRRPRRCGLS